MILVDTDVLIEFRKGDPRAKQWLASLGSQPVPVPGMVAIELIIGSRDKAELARSQKFVNTLDVQWHDVQDHILAYQLIGQYRLSSGLSLQDYIVAAQAISRNADLYSFNLRHFNAISGLKVQAPYIR